MHVLMATIDALQIPADQLVINRTTIQKLRNSNRPNQYYEYDLVDKVRKLILRIL